MDIGRQEDVWILEDYTLVPNERVAFVWRGSIGLPIVVVAVCAGGQNDSNFICKIHEGHMYSDD